ncbi:transcriptional regulator [Desulfitobacterium dichloroeliminans LMG P-21439]|uniref:Transcriptional regulator n=1 Tax=Desulfitobacterium dichloroeliminans (strain LMG P-21439 / DCA1) TaxID=871963 RepID=L0FDE8_DESDL|nr:TetR/AcrR family transcriptional regulator [Desulfitobacterium dichloroeliminans]AGA70676.1 transcriptional regulator [Desulfitobacterium dichloroeliminans LMG P-21439]
MNTKMINRKETLVITAVTIIHEKGLQGLSTREVAQREGVSEAAIFKHYHTKNALIIAVLEHFSQFDEVLAVAACRKEITPRDKMLHIIQGILSYYENYPAITSVLESYGALIHETELREKVLAVFSDRTMVMKNIIDQAKKVGEVAPSIDSEMLVDIILGTFDRMILKWRTENYRFSLKENTLAAINYILASVAPVGQKLVESSRPSCEKSSID